MSRKLPHYPNLEFLRKQAKALLRELQQSDPQMKLADAQHMLAREYGFASWPRLQTHVAATGHPLEGTWVANLERSRRHPANEFQRATIRFAVAGDTLTITDVVVDENGREEQHSNTFVVDGLEHQSAYGNFVLTARWRGARVLETIATKDGAVIGRGTYEVAPDGQTLTVSGEDQLIVLDRAVDQH